MDVSKPNAPADPARGFKKPEKLAEIDKPHDLIELHQYEGLRQIIDAFPYVIRSLHKLETRQSMMDKSQVLVAQQVDAVATSVKTRTNYYKVSYCQMKAAPLILMMLFCLVTLGFARVDERHELYDQGFEREADPCPGLGPSTEG